MYIYKPIHYILYYMLHIILYSIYYLMNLYCNNVVKAGRNKKDKKSPIGKVRRGQDPNTICLGSHQ